MDEFYGTPSAVDIYADMALMSPENLRNSAEYRDQLPPPFESELFGFQRSVVSELVSVNHDQYEQASSVIKAKIASHPSYPKLLDAYIDCQKVGATPEVACLLDEIRREKDVSKQDEVSMCFGVDPELDEFMETYWNVLVKYKTDLSRPFDEATSFLNKIETQLSNLSTEMPKRWRRSVKDICQKAQNSVERWRAHILSGILFDPN